MSILTLILQIFRRELPAEINVYSDFTRLADYISAQNLNRIYTFSTDRQYIVADASIFRFLGISSNIWSLVLAALLYGCFSYLYKCFRKKRISCDTRPLKGKPALLRCESKEARENLVLG